jgi:hypothetical protein
MEKMELAGKLTNLQKELLKVFSMDLDESQLSEIRSLLANYFAQKVTSEVDLLFKENNWDQKKIEEWASDHPRTPYLKK